MAQGSGVKKPRQNLVPLIKQFWVEADYGNPTKLHQLIVDSGRPVNYHSVVTSKSFLLKRGWTPPERGAVPEEERTAGEKKLPEWMSPAKSVEKEWKMPLGRLTAIDRRLREIEGQIADLCTERLALLHTKKVFDYRGK